MVRWGAQVRSSDPARRFDGTDAALARLDPAAGRPAAATGRGRIAPPPAGSTGWWPCAIACACRRRSRRARRSAPTAPCPSYAEEAYADALLYLRRPEEARDAYERVLAQTPKDVEARYGKFYASVELEDFTTAYATIDDLVGDEPIWRTYKDDPSRYDNPERALRQVDGGAGPLLRQPARRGVGPHHEICPTPRPPTPTVGYAVYQIANARGWPRRAEAEAEIAASLAPDDVGSKIALIEVAMANYRFAEAQRLMDELLALYPENQARAAAGARTRRQAPLAVRRRGRSPATPTAAAPTPRARRYPAGAGCTTPPIADNWRLFATRRLCQRPPARGLHPSAARVGAGVEWRIPNLTATI